VPGDGAAGLETDLRLGGCNAQVAWRRGLVGGVVALVVVHWLRRFAAWVAGYIERLTDPVVSRIVR